ncbi:signal peptidase I [Bacillus sp. 165]|uniref:signal peptidase I n=1 Tax=Bacillus sp. 165 TaxID=1529117 RepID=UPI001ADBCC46|nr:signal peptidase I [Bacillus sp. 165]MBO9131455.1 signal peptidase I [Bacillus sp. 165]
MEKKSTLRELIESIGFAFLIVMLLKAFVFFPTKVEGASMEPTLHTGDKLIVSKLVTYTHDLHHGDIVVIKTDDYYVKRIIGLPGDLIEIKNDQLYINGQPQNEPYLKENKEQADKLMMQLTGNFGPISLSNDDVFVMGDNRLVSRDSRNGLGTIRKSEILGKVKGVYYPVKGIRIPK